LSADALDIQKRAVLCIFCDVVAHCSSKVLEQSQQQFAKYFEEAAGSIADVCVRQAGVFALGLLVEKSAGAISSVLPPNNILKLCFAQFSDPRFLGKDDVEDIQDNAAMTIGRVCKFCSDQVNLGEVYPKWLSCFPIRSDEECSQWCYTEMIRLITAQNNAFIGQGGMNIPKIVHWIAEVAFTDMSNETLDKSLVELINNLQANQELMSGIKKELPTYLMEKLEQLC